MQRTEKVSELLTAIPFELVTGPLSSVIENLCFDSRSCTKNSLFFAIHGELYDGHDYIPDAIASGARVIIYTRPLVGYQKDVTYLLTSRSRETMSAVSAWFYKTQENPVQIVGVTGTDGKTSTCYFLYQLLSSLGIRVSLLTTVFYDDGSGLTPNHSRMTTPEAPLIHQFLYTSYKNGMKIAIIEASSHALSYRSCRLADVRFHAAVCTTITEEHLDYHKTVETYIDDKMNLFRQLSGNDAFGICEEQSAAASYIRSVTDNVPATFSITDKHADIAMTPAADTLKGNVYVYDHLSATCLVTLPFTQSFFIHDLAAALITAMRLTGKPAGSFSSSLSDMQLVPGRCVEHHLNDNIFLVDYAHTIDAFEQLFSYYHKVYPTYSFITLFGAAGRRDHAKRAPMGKIAAGYSRLVIITDEDPRDEDPELIFKDICEQLTREEQHSMIHIEKRSDAITYAVAHAQTHDIVLFLGKGHEQNIIHAHSTESWDEVSVVEHALEVYQENNPRGER